MKMKEQYFRLGWCDEDNGGVAYAPKGTDANFLPIEGDYNGNITFEMELRNGEFSDYLGNDLGLSMCSEKLKNILTKYLEISARAQWKEVWVLNKQRSERNKYYFFHLPHKYDVLDNSKTIFAKGSNFVVKAVISNEKVNGLKVFDFTGRYNGIIVSSEVKNAINEEQCTGIEFLKIPNE